MSKAEIDATGLGLVGRDLFKVKTGWHCFCGDRKYSVPCWNLATETHCWNCGHERPNNGHCPINCGCKP